MSAGPSAEANRTAGDVALRMASGLEALLRPIAEVTLDPANARAHSERNLQAIADSLDRFGQQKPIVITPDGTVVAGNGTLEAARSL